MVSNSLDGVDPGEAEKLSDLQKWIKLIANDSIFLYNPNPKEIKELVINAAKGKMVSEELINERFE